MKKHIHSRKSILIVYNEKCVGKALVQIFEGYYDIELERSGGWGALDLIQKRSFDLIWNQRNENQPKTAIKNQPQRSQVAPVRLGIMSRQHFLHGFM